VVQEVSPTFSRSDGEPRALGRSWRAALVSMVVCGLMFEVCYNACNWYTSLRSDVGTWCYDWEFEIPFIPAMIVPYWTLNLFFIGSFFVCSTLAELKVLRTRIGLAILIACSCFLLFPLTLVFPRPEVDGVYGLLFAALRSFDKPYNLSPSLHVALRTLLWPVYVPRTSGMFNLLLRVWFLLIGISTIFTYQHQVIDVASGWLLAIVCLHLVAQPNPEADTIIRVRNGRVGIYYALGGGEPPCRRFARLALGRDSHLAGNGRVSCGTGLLRVWRSHLPQAQWPRCFQLPGAAGADHCWPMAVD
jgi:hypothetical protein